MLGEQFSGPMSDYFAKIYARRKNRVPAPSQRLMFAQVGNILIIVGLYVFLVEILHAGKHWNIKPDIGIAVAAFGCQMVATPCITCKSPVIDHMRNITDVNRPDISDKCPREESANLGVAINAVRLIWAFVSKCTLSQMPLFNANKQKGQSLLVSLHDQILWVGGIWWRHYGPCYRVHDSSSRGCAILGPTRW